MTIPEIPPAHREAVADALSSAFLLLGVEVSQEARDVLAQSALMTAHALGYRVAPGWVACSLTTMPKNPDKSGMVYVLAAVRGCQRARLLGWYMSTGGCRWYDEEDNQFYGSVTHWAPLVELPPPPSSAPAPTTDNDKDANT